MNVSSGACAMRRIHSCAVVVALASKLHCVKSTVCDSHSEEVVAKVEFWLGLSSPDPVLPRLLLLAIAAFEPSGCLRVSGSAEVRKESAIATGDEKERDGVGSSVPRFLSFHRGTEGTGTPSMALGFTGTHYSGRHPGEAPGERN